MMVISNIVIYSGYGRDARLHFCGQCGVYPGELSGWRHSVDLARYKHTCDACGAPFLIDAPPARKPVEEYDGWYVYRRDRRGFRDLVYALRWSWTDDGEPLLTGMCGPLEPFQYKQCTSDGRDGNNSLPFPILWDNLATFPYVDALTANRIPLWLTRLEKM